ncbi:MAG: S8 family peptidase [Burkholderiaceae bacterium]|nr:S8 family peptidase [Burkholderiaceae bacterium]
MAMKAVRAADADQGVDVYKTELSDQYVFARLDGSVVKKLVEVDQREAAKLSRKMRSAIPAVVEQAVGRHGGAVAEAARTAPKLAISRFRAIHHIWPDFELHSCISQSIRTVKADAAQRSFTAMGDGITWAVMDTGIDGLHPHFKLHENIDVASPYHADFTNAPGGAQPLQDDFGHGSHVAGIIAGEGSDSAAMDAISNELDESGNPVVRRVRLKAISGMAPKCKLVSLKVLDQFGMGKASNVIAAIAHVQLLNGHGRDLKIHGVNLSLGHSFDPKWFACGHSPLCTEVNRLVKSGVVVVVAAGNTGYGSLQTKEGSTDACLDLTINDPGNAEYAITVGSTHRDMPHVYGVSYFSSKGPTGDGRCKPDLLAPGEKILSCAAPKSKLVRNNSKGAGADGADCAYFENSGTSMAAPHVSGAIAAFLSIRNEFKGESEKVKRIFTSTATDLGRDRYFQGAGLIDLMRAIQSV